jgi:SPP1 family predicted phage head-tail adaptor
MAIPGGAGELRHRVTLVLETEGKNASGERVTTLADVAALWAAVEPKAGGGEREEDDGQRSLNRYLVRMRWRSGVTTKNAVRLADGRLLRILEIVNPAERREWLDLTCEERTD